MIFYEKVGKEVGEKIDWQRQIVKRKKQIR